MTGSKNKDNICYIRESSDLCIDARFNSGVSKSYTNQRHKVLPNLTRLAVNNRMLDARAPASPATLPNQVK